MLPCCSLSMGTWCSGITPAQHAGGPGLNPQCVHHSRAGVRPRSRRGLAGHRFPGLASCLASKGGFWAPFPVQADLNWSIVAQAAVAMRPAGECGRGAHVCWRAFCGNKFAEEWGGAQQKTGQRGTARALSPARPGSGHTGGGRFAISAWQQCLRGHTPAHGWGQ